LLITFLQAYIFFLEMLKMNNFVQVKDNLCGRGKKNLLMKQIKIIPVVHRGNKQLLVKFDKDFELQAIVKKIPGALWSQTHVSWYVADTPENLELIFRLFKDVAEVRRTTPSRQTNVTTPLVGKEGVYNTPVQSGNSAGSQQSPANSTGQVIVEVLGTMIFLKMANNEADIQFINSLKESTFNKESRLWEITDNTKNRDLIKKYFGKRLSVNIQAAIQNKQETTNGVTSNPSRSTSTNNPVGISYTAKKIFIKLAKNAEDTSFMNSFKYSRFNKATFLWEVPNYGKNLQIIKEYFGKRITEISVDRNQSEVIGNQYSVIGKEKRKQKPDTVDIEIINDRNIKVYFPFSFEHVKKMKTLPLYDYKKEDGNSWTFPYNENILSELESYFNTFKYVIEIKNITTTKEEKEKKYYGNERKIPPEYLEKLTLQRKSINTVRVYTQAFTDFINYYSTKDLKEINYEDIKNYMLYLIEKRKISSSFQNQMINAIKFYYEQVLDQKKIPYFDIERPIKEKTLPPVLSVEEVQAIINTVTNLKHKAILLTIYSGGLRISELINIKIKDIDSKRESIFVKAGKGKKDRLTMLSKKLVVLLRLYIKEYRPKIYLFEGQDGGQYAVSSIQHIFHKACEDAKILKNATVHTLRHSFATHLHDEGVDIKIIKELLGHSSLKTTEIYTHLTFKSMKNIKNPLDNLDF